MLGVRALLLFIALCATGFGVSRINDSCRHEFSLGQSCRNGRLRAGLGECLGKQEHRCYFIELPRLAFENPASAVLLGKALPLNIHMRWDRLLFPSSWFSLSRDTNGCGVVCGKDTLRARIKPTPSWMESASSPPRLVHVACNCGGAAKYHCYPNMAEYSA